MTPDFDSVIFDIDGVLIDSSRSYDLVIRSAVQVGWKIFGGVKPDSTVVTPEHIRIFKSHPAFNDDYDTSWCLFMVPAYQLFAHGIRSLRKAFPSILEWSRIVASCPRENALEYFENRFPTPIARGDFRRLCEELYIGADMIEHKLGDPAQFTKGKGLWRREIPLLNKHWSEINISCGGDENIQKIGIYTGRPIKEAEFALAQLGWEDMRSDLVITLDDGIIKPSPKGLSLLANRMKSSSPLFLGDSMSDYTAWKNFGKGIFAGIGKTFRTMENCPLKFNTTIEAMKFFCNI